MKVIVKKTKREIEVFATPQSTVSRVKFYDRDHPEDEYTIEELIFPEYYGN